jgi:predicted PurR-regulated permease PerM
MSEARHSAAVAYRAILLAAGLLVLGLLFRQLVTLVVAVLITVLIAIPLSAFTTRLERQRVPRPLGALLGLVGALGSSSRRSWTRSRSSSTTCRASPTTSARTCTT